MDIAAASLAMSQNRLTLAASIRVMSLSKDTAEQQANDLVQMLKNAQPDLGNNLDIRV
ncbi:YjfB family protein [Paenibacillus sp. LPE1-1-1.1]|uniref:YjfB family protein n=1 Tax=Paenibacillus sp. LPE1-1-1.1 TaxID=3135230 RepID=UPI0034259CE9